MVDRKVSSVFEFHHPTVDDDSENDYFETYDSDTYSREDEQSGSALVTFFIFENPNKICKKFQTLIHEKQGGIDTN